MTPMWTKQLYNAVPGKKTLFSICKYFGTPPERIFRHLHFHGPFRVQIDKTHSFKIRNYGFQLENEIFWGGLFYRYEKTSLKLWTQLCQKATVIFDVGANTGLYSLIAQSINSESDVHAFEPVERVYHRLEENVRLNNYNIKAVRKALSNTNGSTVIYDSPTEHQYAASLSRNSFGSNVRTEEIKTVTFQDYMKHNNLDRVDLMKIDVEGHEPEVLIGMGEFLLKSKPTLLIEIVEDDLAKKIELLVKEAGYLFYDVNENEGCHLKSQLAKSSNNNWLLCSKEVASFLNLSTEIK